MPESIASVGERPIFSLEKLIDFAKRLGNDVEIRLKPSRTPRLKVA